MQSQHFRCKVSLTGFDDFLGFLVSKTTVAVDDGPAKPLIDHARLVVNFKDGRKTEFVFMRSQRTEFIGKPFRQHGYGAVYEVYGGGALECLLFGAH